MSERSVYVWEVGVMHAVRNRISKWEVWDSFNTYEEAVKAISRERLNRPTWVTEEFFKATNRIRRYVPGVKG